MSEMIDGGGVIGQIFFACTATALAGTALLVFMCAWKAGQLGLDEGPKERMMERDNDE